MKIEQSEAYFISRVEERIKANRQRCRENVEALLQNRSIQQKEPFDTKNGALDNKTLTNAPSRKL